MGEMYSRFRGNDNIEKGMSRGRENDKCQRNIC